MEWKSGGGATPDESSERTVEAKFYGDGTWNKAILGAQLGPDRQQVKFVGYEEDGWQDTAAKDIRYPALKIGKAKVAAAGALGEASAAAARGDTATPTKAADKNAKDGKAGKAGRSGKKWEVVSGFMEQATSGDSTNSPSLPASSSHVHISSLSTLLLF